MASIQMQSDATAPTLDTWFSGTSLLPLCGIGSEKKKLETWLQSYPDLECPHKIYDDDHKVKELRLKWPTKRFWGMCAPSTTMEPLWAFSRIAELKLERCHFLALPNQIGKLKTLKTLTLEDVSVVPSDIGQLCNLETLVIRNCSSIGSAISQELDSLKMLRIECLQFYGPFQQKKDLVGLKKKGNFRRLKTLCISGLYQETVLDLFSEPWAGSDELEELGLTRCNLGSEFWRILPNLPKSLVKLRMEWNGIDYFHHPALQIRLPVRLRSFTWASHFSMLGLGSSPDQLDILLDQNPLLGRICGPCDLESWVQLALLPLYAGILFKLFFNRCGGQIVLFDQQKTFPSIPLSVWPKILERAANPFQEEADIFRYSQENAFRVPRVDSSLIMEDAHLVSGKIAENRISVLYNLIREQPSLLMGPSLR